MTAPITKPSAYTKDTTLDLFFSRDPKTLTDAEIDQIITVNRVGYKTWYAAEQSSKRKNKHTTDDDWDMEAPVSKA